jgi:hypothetical protein
MITINSSGWKKVEEMADKMISAHRQFPTAEEAVAHVQSQIVFLGDDGPDDKTVMEYLMTIWITVNQCSPNNKRTL